MGDEHARKTTSSKKTAAKELPSCLVRASLTSGKSKKKIATVVGSDSCDLFRKRLTSVFKSCLLRTKKKRAGSQ